MVAFKWEYYAGHNGDRSDSLSPSFSKWVSLSDRKYSSEYSACVRACGLVHTSRSRLCSLQEMTHNMTWRFNPMCPASSSHRPCWRDNRLHLLYLSVCKNQRRFSVEGHFSLWLIAGNADVTVGGGVAVYVITQIHIRIFEIAERRCSKFSPPLTFPSPPPNTLVFQSETMDPPMS